MERSWCTVIKSYYGIKKKILWNFLDVVHFFQKAMSKSGKQMESSNLSLLNSCWCKCNKAMQCDKACNKVHIFRNLAPYDQFHSTLKNEMIHLFILYNWKCYWSRQIVLFELPLTTKIHKAPNYFYTTKSKFWQVAYQIWRKKKLVRIEMPL